MNDREFYLTIGWLVIVGITSLVAAILFCENVTIRLLIITGCILLIIAFAMPFIYEREE